MKLLITGGAGFVGSHLVRRTLALGHDVVVLDNLSTGRRENLEEVADHLEFFEGDITIPSDVEQAITGCDAVLHQAALPSVPRSIADPAASHEVNATGTLNVLIAARDAGVERFVFASSSSVYGATPGLPKQEEMPTLPLSPYAVAKSAAESYCRSFHGLYDLETVALRYFNVFGPRQDPASEYAAVVPRFIQAFRAETPPTIYGDGETSRDFTYVENVVDANMAALEAPAAPGNVYNIACGERITLNQLAAGLRAQLNTDIEPVHGPARPGEVRHSLADVSRARKDLGYEPRIGLTEGLHRTVTHLTAEPMTVSA